MMLDYEGADKFFLGMGNWSGFRVGCEWPFPRQNNADDAEWEVRINWICERLENTRIQKATVADKLPGEVSAHH
jgi:hypothetical protein